MWNCLVSILPLIVDLYVMCVCVCVCVCRFQELDLSAQCLISNESAREEPWINCVTTTLRKAGSYIMVSEEGLCVCWLTTLALTHTHNMLSHTCTFAHACMFTNTHTLVKISF